MHLAAIQAAERCVMNLATCDGGADWDVPASKRLGQGHDVGFEIPVFRAEKASGTSHPDLNFVADKKRAVFSAQALGLGQVVVSWDVHALALNGFDDESGNVSVT